MSIEILRLNLGSPLFFNPNSKTLEPNTELLFIYELDESQYQCFEPDMEKFIQRSIINDDLILPAGDYIFTQKKENLSMEGTIKLAVEMQAEGLWQRLKPGRYLYVRKLFEDGSIVTQLFRPCL